MAKTTRIDELNIVEYFSEMDLPEDEIQRRIEIANALFGVYQRGFAIYKTMQAVEELDEDYIEDYFQFNLEQELHPFFGELDEVTEEYINNAVKSILNTTLKTENTSDNRAKMLASNDANVIGNHYYHESMKKMGYKFKRWNTQEDEKVRLSHMLADGQVQEIDQPFNVGYSQMMYPCDLSLGADLEEIINCRCTCQYF